MDVQHTARVLPQEFRGQDAHEAGQAHQRGRVGTQGRQQTAGRIRPARFPAMATRRP